MQNFAAVNRVDDNNNDSSKGEPFYQRFSAFRWMPMEGGDGKNRNSNSNLRGGRTMQQQKQRQSDPSSEHEQLSIQQDAMEKYPFLRYSVQKGLPGTAGCSFSHILLLEQLLLRSSSESDRDDYYFVFEDDAKLTAPLLQNRVVEGPPDADIIILSPTSTKTVRVPYMEEDGFAVRVLQSYGAFAYIITKDGAAKLLRDFRDSKHDDPIDVAFHRAADIKMYHPTNGWPQAYHAA
ncbi:MAG: hypothetical protein SGARI_007760, partial [Bacillariaceae sp.]